MKLKGEITGELSLKGAKLNPKQVTKVAVVRLSVRMDRELTKTTFGKDFAELVLPELGKTSRDATGAYHHPYTTLKPVAVFESHKVKILDREMNSIPELAGVSTVDGEEAIDAEIDIPIDIVESQKEFYGDLMTSVGDSIGVTFEPRQLSLGLV